MLKCFDCCREQSGSGQVSQEVRARPSEQAHTGSNPSHCCAGSVSRKFLQLSGAGIQTRMFPGREDRGSCHAGSLIHPLPPSGLSPALKQAVAKIMLQRQTLKLTLSLGTSAQVSPFSLRFLPHLAFSIPEISPSQIFLNLRNRCWPLPRKAHFWKPAAGKGQAAPSLHTVNFLGSISA